MGEGFSGFGRSDFFWMEIVFDDCDPNGIGVGVLDPNNTVGWLFDAKVVLPRLLNSPLPKEVTGLSLDEFPNVIDCFALKGCTFSAAPKPLTESNVIFLNLINEL